MPTYTYICENSHDYQEVRAMTEKQRQTTCPKQDCGATLKRVFESVPVQFKGSGWAGKGR
jgi:putative FmdB family regulatory protein